MPEDTRSGGFWRSIPGILTAAAGTITAMAGLVAALSQAGFLDRAPDASAEATPSIVGRWSAQVTYPWDLTIEETFSFRVEGDRIIGTATYLGYPRAIEAGRFDSESLSFSTRAEEILGDETRAYENLYDGIVSVRGINFVLQDTRGIGPIEFTARRSD